MMNKTLYRITTDHELGSDDYVFESREQAIKVARTFAENSYLSSETVEEIFEYGWYNITEFTLYPEEERTGIRDSVREAVNKIGRRYE